MSGVSFSPGPSQPLHGRPGEALEDRQGLADHLGFGGFRLDGFLVQPMPHDFPAGLQDRLGEAGIGIHHRGVQGAACR